MKRVLFFIILFFPAICLHELGHLLMAFHFNLHPHSFNIGFGQVIASFPLESITLNFGWIPLGGYVLTPQADLLGNPALQAPWITMIFAGPLTNFLIALILLIGLSITICNAAQIFKSQEKNLLLVIFSFPHFLTYFFSKNINYKKFKVVLPHFEITEISSEEFSKLLVSTTSLSSGKLFYHGSFSQIKFMGQTIKNFLLFKPSFGKSLFKAATTNLNLEKNNTMTIFKLSQVAQNFLKQSFALFLILVIDLNLSLAIFNLLPLSFTDAGQILRSLYLIFTHAALPENIEKLWSVLSFLFFVSILFAGFFKDLLNKIKNPN